MNLRTTDFLLSRFAHRMPGALKLLGDMETDLLRRRLDGLTVDRPIMICGLARSGSTILLNLFSGLPQVGTHRYRDFPFVFLPYSWNQFQDRLSSAAAPVERPHRDRILITKDSPEALEELLWMHFFPFVHDASARHLLTGGERNPEFDAFYREHLCKILLVRGRQRYVSKGNYNVARIEYIARLLPDARFVIPIRHPVTHVNSLIRQHRLFVRYSEEDGRVPQYMRSAGHYEFGPQRVPINLDDNVTRRILASWAAGEDDLGFAQMWRSIYAYILGLVQRGGELGRRIKFVRYEDFCASPAAVLAQLFEFCELSAGVPELLRDLPEISPPPPGQSCLSEPQQERVWGETAELAEGFGYHRDWTCRGRSDRR